MRLLVNALQEYNTADAKRGVCKLWLFGNGGNLAVVVLTQLPGDPSPDSLESSLDIVAGRIVAERRLDPGRTLWYLRTVTQRGSKSTVERFREIEFSVSAVKSMYDARTTPCERSAVEHATGCTLPNTTDEEITPV